MSALSQEAFVLKAIERLPNEESRHLGTRLGKLELVFQQHFGVGGAVLDTVLDRLIRKKKIVAARLVWTVHPYDYHGYRKSSIKEVVRLTSFPDPHTEEKDPILYLPDRIPRLIKIRLSTVQNALDRILED